MYKVTASVKEDNIIDDELIAGVRNAMSEVTEPLKNLTSSSQKQAVKVNACSYMTGQNAYKIVQCENKGKRDFLMTTLEAVKGDIATIKVSMAQNKLHQNTSPLGCERVVELSRKRVFWSYAKEHHNQEMQQHKTKYGFPNRITEEIGFYKTEEGIRK